MFPTQHHTYSNGARLLRVVAPLHTATALVTVGVGARHEDARLSGIAHLSEHVRFRGTRNFPTGAAINSAFEASGGEHNAETGSETMTFYATCLPDELTALARLLTDLVVHPLFDKAALDSERPVVLQEISAKQTPLSDAAVKTLFGDHPAALPIPGTRASVARITAAHLREHHLAHFVGPNVVAVVVAPADVPTAALVDAFAALAELGGGLLPQRLRFDGHVSDPAPRHVASPVATPSVALVYPACGHRAPDAVALSLLTAMMQRISGPLFQRLRHELGLLYDFSVAPYQIAEGGGLVVQYDVRAPDLEATTREMLALLHALGSDPARLAEPFAAARKSVLTWAAQTLDTPHEIATFYAMEMVFRSNLTPAEWVARLHAVTLERVCALAAEVFVPARLRLLTSGKVAPRLRAQVRALVEPAP